ncbi:hypothetical protein [Brevibacillus daliensis]|uniref:hypothetical protein n=1 Tax=Brevibacillus daliensis TaxID=2892995 RepID=UPI001E5DDCB0|nr:hypothetical protein [Brevibacillus daliensis]
MKKVTFFIGALLIIASLLLMTISTSFFSIQWQNIGQIVGIYWPSIFMLPIAIILHIIHFSKVDSNGDILIGAGFLLIASFFFQISMLYNIWGYMWPGTLLAIAFGMFEAMLLGKDKSKLIIPASILSLLSLIFFASTIGKLLDQFDARYIVAIPLLLVGVAIIIMGIYSSRKKRF